MVEGPIVVSTVGTFGLRVDREGRLAIQSSETLFSLRILAPLRSFEVDMDQEVQNAYSVLRRRAMEDAFLNLEFKSLQETLPKNSLNNNYSSVLCLCVLRKYDNVELMYRIINAPDGFNWRVKMIGKARLSDHREDLVHYRDEEVSSYAELPDELYL